MIKIYVFLLLAVSILLTGCAKPTANWENPVLSTSIPLQKATLIFEVEFSTPPDRVPYINIKYFREATELNMNMRGIMPPFMLPHPRFETDTATALMQINAEQLTPTRYRILVPKEDDAWHTNNTFTLFFRQYDIDERASFRFTTEKSCNSNYYFSTPQYSFFLKINATFNTEQTGCIKPCDIDRSSGEGCAPSSFSNFK